jgi:O-antigen ligase
MNSERVDRWCESGILALVLAVLVLGPLALGAVRGLEFGIIEGLTVAVMLLWGARLWLSRRAQLLWPPICFAVLAFAAYAVGRYFTAEVEYVARQEVLRVLVYAFLFVAILNNLHRQETVQVISLTMIFLGMAISFYALYQFLTGSDSVWTFIKPYPHRGSGTYICPNHLGGFLELLLPLGLSYALLGRLKPVTRILAGYASLVIIAGIAVTVSRGAWVSSVLALLVFFGVLLSLRQFRLPALIMLVLFVGAGIFLFPKSIFLQLRVKRVLTQQRTVNDDLRFALWGPAFRMWQENLWVGVGPAHFESRFRAYRPEGVQMTAEWVHNDYLNTLADWGAGGTALVSSAWVLLGLGLAKTWKHVRLSSGELGGKSGSNKFAFVLGASLGLLAILAHSFIDFNMHIPANAILVVTLMALLSAHLRFATDRYWVRAGAWLKTVVSVPLLCGAALLIPQGWRHAAESVWIDRAARAPAYSNTQIDLLGRAFAVEPRNAETAYAIGEALRRQSQEGGASYEGQEGVDYRQLAERAMHWFELGMRLNRWDSRNYAGYGWCLDWLDRPEESASYFDQAEQLDPNNYYNLNNIGLHYVQLGQYAAAIPWFERSLRLEGDFNPVAQNYLEIAQIRLAEAITNEISARLDSLPK